MTSFDRLLHPSIPERHTSEFQTGLIPGWIPGEITSIEPSDGTQEGLGRVRVRCDLFSATDDIPNSFDGYVWVLEDFANNGTVGGSHRPLQQGSQVALLPMLGNPQQLLMIGAIHSRVDRPNPIFDRTKGVHGSHTPGQVFSIKDDKNGERTDAYPNGVTQQVTRTGDVIDQTAGGARSHLQQDGTVRLENPQSGTTLDPDGTITSHNAAGATSVLGADGSALVRSQAFDSALKLDALTSELTAPMPPIGALFSQAKEAISGTLGQVSDVVSQIQQISDRLGADNLISSGAAMGKILSQVGGVTEKITKGIDKINKLREFSVEDLGGLLLPQVREVLGSKIHEISPAIQGFLGRDFNLEKINQVLNGFDLQLPDETSEILNQLSYSPELQEQIILEGVLGNYKKFENLAGLKLHAILGSLSEVLSLRSPLLQESDSINQDLLRLITPLLPVERYQQFIDLVPKELRSHLQDLDFKSLVDGIEPDPEEVFTQMLGRISQGFLGQSESSLNAVLPLAEKIPQLSQGIGEIIRGRSGNLGLGNLVPDLAPDLALKEAIGSISEQLQPALEKALGSFNQVLGMMPSSFPKPKIEATFIKASLQDATGASEVFAGAAGAGVSTPWGGFGFAAAGFIMKSLKPVLMRLKGSKGGLNLHPTDGASLEGYTNDSLSSKVQALGDTIVIQAGIHSVIVSPNGVFIDQIEIASWITRFQSLETRLAILEAGFTPPVN